MQVGHSCLEAGRRFEQADDESHLVVLAVPNQTALYEASLRCTAANIRHVLFYKPDDDMRHTALCTEPIAGAARAAFKKFRLWGH